MRYFAANLQTAEIGTIGDTPTNPAWGTDAGEPVQVGDSYYLAEAEEGFLINMSGILRFSVIIFS